METQNKQENVNPVRGNPPKADASHAFQSRPACRQAGRTSNGINVNRRRFLTAMLVGGGAFLAERILSPLFSRFANDPSARRDLPDKPTTADFKIVQNKKGLSVYDGSGDEILQIDKGA